jgi:hypothetical protein
VSCGIFQPERYDAKNIIYLASMRTLFQFLTRSEYVLYILAGVAVFFAFRGIVQSRQVLRTAIFGLEREAAQNRLSRSWATIFGMLMLSGSIYIAVNILAPNFTTIQAEPTPTPFLLLTQPPTATEPRLIYPTVTPTSAIVAAGVTPPAASTTNGCELFGARITNPTSGQTVSGRVVVEGEANIINFAQYKFEVKGASTGEVWIVVGNYSAPIAGGVLGAWDSTSLAPGDYILRMVVSRVDGTYPTPCEVAIKISAPGAAPEATP